MEFEQARKRLKKSGYKDDAVILILESIGITPSKKPSLPSQLMDLLPNDYKIIPIKSNKFSTQNGITRYARLQNWKVITKILPIGVFVFREL